MSTPRTKRPFAGAAADPSQRQITSFFSPVSAASASAAHSSPLQPEVPASVQSNLLSVGMRVRKSVPEGYKTGTTSAFKLWTDSTVPSSTTRPSSLTTRRISRELLPFCGINKVGGLDTQPEFQDDEDDDVPPLDTLPELTMSQESTHSTDSIGSSRKRLLDEEDEAVPLAWHHPKRLDGDLGARSLTPSPFGNSRLIAVPRSRVRKSVSFKDQENMALDEDFDEAEFLVFNDGPEEVDMLE
ncbi:hypothetical protein S7711_04899 [Stachybotrys chartarum IBT 7711]|uniref:Uncharacterized protein n=1 Tax=Stachybotrys chartarum (strain CBS 109288 / IBT 7711) TaxID=1280523 RepID=A0A084B6H2_STACB|nr:hypothetical protein S7711_04899 [Stachybotrys chartarum IBT 7711]